MCSLNCMDPQNITYFYVCLHKEVHDLFPNCLLQIMNYSISDPEKDEMPEAHYYVTCS